jgi:hypothetical protein
MIRNSLRAVRFALICLLCLTPQTPIYPAQEPNTPAGDIFGPPRYQQIKLPDGAVEYSDLEIGVSFTLPHDWDLGNDGLRFMDRGWKGNGDGDIATSVFLHHKRTDEGIWLYYCVFRHVYRLTPDQTDKWLGEESDDKISQRRIGERLKGYRVRPSSYERKEIGGQRALAWVADFIQGKISMVEYEVIVRSDNSLAEFSIRCPASELDATRKDVQPIIQSVRMR